MKKTKDFFPLSIAIAIVVLFSSSVVMLGWLFQKEAWIRFFSNTGSMQFNTALFFILLQSALILLIYKKIYLTRILSSLVVVFCFFVLLQDLFGNGFKIDEFFLKKILKGFVPGKIASNTIICFILIGSSIFISTLEKIKLRFLITTSLVAIVVAIMLAALIGYWSNLETAYGWVQTTKITLLTACLFVLLGISVFLYSWESFSNSQEKWFFPWFSIPFSIFILTSTICLWLALRAQEHFSIIKEHAEAAEEVQTLLDDYFVNQIQIFDRKALRWAVRGKTPRAEWDADVAIFLEHMPPVKAIDWIDPEGIITWPYPDQAPKPFPYPDVLQEAYSKKKPQLFQKEKKLFLLTPIVFENQLKGFFFITYDLKTIFKTILSSAIDSSHSISIDNGTRRLFNSAPSSEKDPVTKRLSMMNWTVKATSRKENNSWKLSLANLALLIGFMITSLAFATAYLGFKARLHSIDLENALQELHETQKRLIQQEKMASLNTVTAGIAHEIKNPLTFVNTFSELSIGLLKELDEVITPKKEAFSNEQYQEISEAMATLKDNMEGIHQHGLRASNIMQRMASHAEDKSAQKLPTDVRSLIEEYLGHAYRGFRTNQPNFTVEFHKDYQDEGSPIQVIPDELGRVLLNLFNNAFYTLQEKQKAADKDFTPEIYIKTSSEGKYFCIFIRDNGEGIPSYLQEKIFMPFFTTKPPGLGTGLGLSLSHKIIVQEHEGRLEFISMAGEFTEFKISIPNRQF